MKTPTPSRGVTLIELMITVAIIAIVLSIALVTLTGYLPKQRLITSQGMLADILQRAQTEANARSYWTCVTFAGTDAGTGTPVNAQVFVDVNGDHGSPHSCGNSGDTLLTSYNLKTDVQLSNGTNCTNNITKDCVIWFDTTGAPKLCAADKVKCGLWAQTNGPAGTSCIDWSYQLLISIPKLDAGTRSRKVEALAGGLIQVVKPSDSGLVTTYGAVATTSASGTAGCE